MASSGQALDGLKSSRQDQLFTHPLVSLRTPLRLLRSVSSLRDNLAVLLIHLSAGDIAEKSSRASSPKQIPPSVHPVQIAQTDDNTLVLKGVGVIETLVSSEISSSVVTLTAFKTIVLTSVSTSMICTCDNTLSPCKLIFHVHFRVG